MRAISIRQPWAYLIVKGIKDIENRDWPTRFRGELFVHAGKRFDKAAYEYLKDDGVDLPEIEEFQLGGIVGKTTIVDCVDHHESDWFIGDYGFVLKDSEPVEFIPCRSQLGIFSPEIEDNQVAQ